MKKICFVNAIKGTAESFLRPHFYNFQKEYEVHFVSGDVTDGCDETFPGVKCHRVGIVRPISLIEDCKAVLQLYKLIQKERFDSIHSVTPKAGLVTAIAARMAGVKIRCHTFTGQVWATRAGLMRKLLRMMDHIIFHLDNHIFVDGEAQRQYLISEGILTEKKSSVLANGSLLGADINRFCPNPEIRNKYRKEIGIKNNHFVFVFLGRLNIDKGIRELLSAFDRIAGESNENDMERPYLLILGRDEENMVSVFDQYSNIKQGVNFCHYGYTLTPEHVMQAADVFVLPTYREGFPQSPLEAGALALPIIISDIYGTKASIVDNETGIRCQPQDTNSLYSAMRQMIDDPDKARSMGQAGRRYIEQNYDQKILEKAWLQLYHELLEV